MNYFSTDKTATEAAEAEIFAAFRDQVGMVDPDAVAEDGTIIGRNAATGELEPEATRTTGFYGAPAPMVQGWAIPQPEDEDLQLADPAATGVELTANLNPWPSLSPAAAPPPLPAWVKPTNASETYPVGAWVEHQGVTYRSLLPGNDQPPKWPSLFWAATPEPAAPAWVKPAGYQDVYPKDSVVEHNGKQWVSLIAANNETPGVDPTNRYWGVAPAGEGPQEWSQPMPGGHRPYALGEKCLKDGKTWVSTAPMNVWPAGAERSFWEEG